MMEKYKKPLINVKRTFNLLTGIYIMLNIYTYTGADETNTYPTRTNINNNNNNNDEQSIATETNYGDTVSEMGSQGTTSYL